MELARNRKWCPLRLGKAPPPEIDFPCTRSAFFKRKSNSREIRNALSFSLIPRQKLLIRLSGGEQTLLERGEEKLIARRRQTKELFLSNHTA